MFYSLQIAKTALYSAQKALEVTGHNIANANTPGYKRQRVVLSAVAPSGKDSALSDQKAMSGGGVQVTQISRLTDKYLDIQYRNETSLLNELDIKNYSLKHMEGVFAEPSAYGISAALSEFFNSFDDLNNNPHEGIYREVAVQSAVKLTDTINNIAGEAIRFRQETNRNVTLITDRINDVARKIAQLNDRIHYFEGSGKTANDLRDERDLLIDQLSESVNITVSEYQDGKIRISVGGTALVDGFEVNEVVVKPVSVCSYSGESLYGVFWEKGGNQVAVKSGTLKGLLDVRDGITADNKGIPYFLDRLDTLAKTIVQSFNEANKKGYTLPFNDNPSVTGVDFFHPDMITAATMRVSDALTKSGYNIALSDKEVVEGYDFGNNKNAKSFFDVINSKDITVDGAVTGGIRAYYQKTVSDLAITTGFNANRLSSQKVLTEYIQNQRLSVSEVSIDEEMINLVQFQHAYSAAAQYITVVDKLMEQLMGIIR